MDNKKVFINNPLGIIGFFLVIVEGIAGFVIVQSTLSNELNTILVWFIVVLPILVLITFVFLVTKHHEKLYSPKDFENQEHFLMMVDKYTMQKTQVLTSNNKINRVSKQYFYGGENTTNKLIPLQKNVTKIGLNDELSNFNTIFQQLAEKNISNIEIKAYSSTISAKALNNIDTFDSMWIGSKVDIKKAMQIILALKEIAPEIINLSIRDFLDDDGEYDFFIGSVKPLAITDRIVFSNLTLDDYNKFENIETMEELIEYSKTRKSL